MRVTSAMASFLSSDTPTELNRLAVAAPREKKSTEAPESRGNVASAERRMAFPWIEWVCLLGGGLRGIP